MSSGSSIKLWFMVSKVLERSMKVALNFYYYYMAISITQSYLAKKKLVQKVSLCKFRYEILLLSSSLLFFLSNQNELDFIWWFSGINHVNCFLLVESNKYFLLALSSKNGIIHYSFLKNTEKLFCQESTTWNYKT